MEDVFWSILQRPPFPQIVTLDSCTAYCILLFFQVLCLMDPIFPELFKLVRLGILYELYFNSFSLKFEGLCGSSKIAVFCCTYLDCSKVLIGNSCEEITRLRSYTNVS